MFRWSWKLRHLVAFSLATLSLASACGGQEQHQEEPIGLTEALQSTSDFQRELLKDGKLSYEEYESSVLATVGCLKSAGVTISVEPRRVQGNRLEFAYASTDATDASASASYESCYHQYQNLVDVVWFQQNQPSEQTIQEARSALAACLKEAGSNIPDDPTSADFLRLVRAGDPAVPGCQRKISADFDLPESFIG